MFDGQVAIVTGGSRGIGRAVALSLAAAGAKVAVVYAGNAQAAADTVTEIEAAGGTARAYQLDISEEENAVRTVKQIADDFGTIDILVNNAGVTKDGLSMRMSDADFMRVIQVNLLGTFHMIRACLPVMMKKRYGRIISIASVVGIRGNAGQANYAASKAGVIGMTKSIAREVAARGITVNAVAPGYVATDMTEQMSDKAKEAILSQVPMAAVGQPKDIANAVAFLAGPASGYMTGVVLNVDGGMCM